MYDEKKNKEMYMQSITATFKQCFEYKDEACGRFF